MEKKKLRCLIVCIIIMNIINISYDYCAFMTSSVTMNAKKCRFISWWKFVLWFLPGNGPLVVWPRKGRQWGWEGTFGQTGISLSLLLCDFVMLWRRYTVALWRCEVVTNLRLWRHSEYLGVVIELHLSRHGVVKSRAGYFGVWLDSFRGCSVAALCPQGVVGFWYLVYEGQVLCLLSHTNDQACSDPGWSIVVLVSLKRIIMMYSKQIIYN